MLGREETEAFEGDASPTAARAVAESQPVHQARRTDIELLRVVAIIGVMAFHFDAGFTFAPNGFLGVDVFFTISGFVITTQMLSARARGDLTYAWFLARRVRRLLPSAILVIAVTAIVMGLVADRVYVKDQAPAAVAALLYVSNFFFASQAVDYFGGDLSVSPFLHFWSLAVEEQFYVVWPFVVIGLTLWCRRRGTSFPRALAVVSVVGFLLSAVGAGFAVQSNASYAFFMPWWRAYQLLLGALVALWLASGRSVPSIHVGSVNVVRMTRIATIVVLVAIYAIPAFGMTSPGPWSLVVAIPVALVLATPDLRGGDPLVRWGALRPFAWIATCSYVLYLWHWPVWVLLRSESQAPAFVLVVAAVLASVLLSWATHVGVELPLRDGVWVRRLPNHRTVAIGLAASVVVAVLIGGVARALPLPGWQAELRPAIAALADDASPDTQDCFAGLPATTVSPCTRGVESAGKTVMLVGDSHAIQWQSGFVAAAVADGFRLVTATKQSCPIWDLPVRSQKLQRTYTECSTWREALFAQIEAVKPDILVLSSTSAWTIAVDAQGASILEPEAELSAGVAATLSRVMPAAGRTVVLEEIPLLPKAPGRCLGNSKAAADCNFVGDPDGRGQSAVRAAIDVAGATGIDAFSHLCPVRTTCSMVDGPVIIYRDSDHVTNTYSGAAGSWIAGWLKPLL